MILEDSGAVFAGTPGGPRSSATFPMACVTRSGRWLCAFRAAPAKASLAEQEVLLAWSSDCGRTWREPIAPFVPPDVDGKPGSFRFAGLTRLHGGRVLAALSWVEASAPGVPYFDEHTESLLDTRIFLAVSDDDGETWSDPERVDTAPFNVPVPLTGPVIRFEDDELACPFELNKPQGDPEPWRHASVLLYSADGGRTWPRHSVVARDPENRVFYWDQRVSLLHDGRLFAAFWTYDREAGEYRTIHTRVSHDRGRTWEPLHDTGVAGQPGPVFELEDGELAMPVVDRKGTPRITVRRSMDGGATWPADDVLVVHEAAGGPQTKPNTTMGEAWAEMEAFTLGLPNAAPLPGGGAVLVYYAGKKADETGIRWAKIE